MDCTGRRARRRRKRPSDSGRSEQHFDKLLVFGLAQEIRQERRSGQFVAPLQTHLQKDVDFLVADPIRLRRLERRVGEAAATVRFLPLDCHEGFLGADVTGHNLELGFEEVVQHDGKRIGLRSCSCSSHHHFACLDVVDTLERAGAPRDADTDIAANGADPVEFAHVVVRIARADQWLEQRAAWERSEDTAVARSLFGEVVCGSNAPRAWHDLNDHRRIAWNMASDVTSDPATIEIDTTAGRASHQNGNGFGERLHALRGGSKRQRKQCRRCNRSELWRQVHGFVSSCSIERMPDGSGKMLLLFEYPKIMHKTVR